MNSVGQIKLQIPVGLLATLLVVAGASGQPSTTNRSLEAFSNATTGTALPRVRLPAVAGLFYPRDAQTLGGTIDRMLAAAKPKKMEGIRALICPHAGYEYSGPTAALAYKLISGGDYRTVIILAPSHYALFRGASIPAAAEYETPLGQVPISEKVQQLLGANGIVQEPHCLVQRPQWSTMASRPEGKPGEDTPDTWEHSAEVQVPFLQQTLKGFRILPVIFGETDPELVSKALAPLVDDSVLVIASSDLSHYHPYEEARRLDRRTIDWIVNLNIPSLQSDVASESACGRLPILTLLHLAKLKGWKPVFLDYRNSGDTAGDKNRVVGYAAFAFVAVSAQATLPPTSTSARAEFGPSDRKFLLDLARQTLRGATSNAAMPEVAPGSVPAACRLDRGCFVTLTQDGQLRGCIGNIQPSGPLYRAVSENTRSAALRDSRFRPVSVSESPKLHIEISVLSVLEPLRFGSPEDLLAKLQPHRDGVVLRIGDAGATFLPQVWEQLPDKVEFLNHLAEKAGCPPSAWRGKDVTVSIYHVEAFEESK